MVRKRRREHKRKGMRVTKITETVGGRNYEEETKIKPEDCIASVNHVG